jgi:hypothetical protein
LAVGEGAADSGGPAGYLQQAVDVLQVGADGSAGYAQPAGDLGIGVPGGHQVQQFLLADGEPRAWVTAAFGFEVRLVKVRLQNGEQVTVTPGEIWAGPADEDQSEAPPRSDGPPGSGG